MASTESGGSTTTAPTADGQAVAPAPSSEASVTVSEKRRHNPINRENASLFVRIVFSVLYLVGGLLFNPRWYLWNRLQIHRLTKKRKAIFLGAGKIMYTWPLITGAAIMTTLAHFGVSLGVLGYIYAALFIVVIIVVACNLSRHSFGIVAFGITFLVLVAVVLQLGYQIQVSTRLGHFLAAFHPGYPTGFANLIGFALLVINLLDVANSFKRNSFRVDGNNYIPRTAIGYEGEMSHTTHAVFVDKGGDYMEGIWPFKSGTFYVVNRTEAQKLGASGAFSTHGAAVVVENMSGAMQIKHAIDRVMASEDVEAIPTPRE